jgi:cytochrome c biogenesis protein CcdA
MKKVFSTLLIMFLFVLGTHGAIAQEKTERTAVVFFNEACKDCGELVKDSYPALFGEYEYALELKDYINERENRKILSEMNEAWGVPFELQSHIEVFVERKLLIGGHVPETTVRYLLEHPDQYDRLLVFQDKMHGEETEYRVWDFSGEIKTYAIDEPITTYLDDRASDPVNVTKQKSFWSLFALITSSAFLDGLNPCAFAVLLFFIGFLFTIKKTKAKIWKMGIVYIGAIYLAYLLIGLGIAQAIVISGAPHLMAKIGAYLVMTLGLIQLIGVAFPAFPIKLRIPLDTKATLEKWMYKATLPAAFIGGFLVGLCTFPCSGGIYVAIIGLLAAQRTRTSGFAWMLWYNFIFVLPLFILLFLSSNKRTTEKLQAFEQSESKHTKILIGAFMVALGAIILIFFT